MPEFESQYAGPYIHPSAMVRAYLEAAEFTDCGPDAEAELREADGFSPEAIAEAAQYCAEFQAANAASLAAAYAAMPSYDEQRAGHDLWLTRNHHGAGFWDRGLGEVGERLTKAAHGLGERSLYAGDDCYLYFG